MGELLPSSARRDSQDNPDAAEETKNSQDNPAAADETRNVEPAAHAVKEEGGAVRRAGKRKTIGNGISAFDTVADLQSIYPQSLPWNEDEIRLVDSSSQGVLQEESWYLIDAAIMECHKRFIKEVRGRDEPITPYLMKRLYYCREMMCGVIQVASPSDVRKFRKDFIPYMHLPIQVKGLLKTDNRVPLVTTFASQTYKTYSDDEYIEMLKMVHPLIAGEVFKVILSKKKDLGRQLFIQTSHRVVKYILANGYRLQHAVGEAIFERRIEFVADEYVYSKDPQEQPEN
jgi:hypothetical protein